MLNKRSEVKLPLVDKAEIFIDAGYHAIPIGQDATNLSTLKGAIVNKWQHRETFNLSEWERARGIGIQFKNRIVAIDRDATDIKMREAVDAVFPPAEVERFGNPGKSSTLFFEVPKGIDIPGRYYFKSISVEVLSEGHYCAMYLPYNGSQYYRISNFSRFLEGDFPPLTREILDDLSRVDNLFKVAKIAVAKEDGDSTGEAHDFGKLESGRCRRGSHHAMGRIMLPQIDRGDSKEAIVNELIRVDKEVNRDSDYYYFNCPTRRWKYKKLEDNAEWLIDDRLNRTGQKIPDKGLVQVTWGKSVVMSHPKKDENKKKKALKKVRLPDGIGKEIYSYIYSNSRIKRRSFSFASTLSLFSVLSGNRCHFRRTLPNIYCLICAETGQGKDWPLKSPLEILNEAAMHELIGQEDYGSGTAMFDGFPNQRVRLDSIDEASDLFAAFNDRGNYHNANKGDVLTKLFSASGKLFTGKRNRTDGEIGKCFSPMLSIIMATTPAGLKQLHYNNFVKGLGPRIMFFFDDRPKKPNYELEIAPISSDMANFIANFRSFGEPNKIADIVSIPLESGNVNDLYQFYEQFGLERKEEDDVLRGMDARKVEYFHKLALLHHVMKGDDASWGVAHLNEKMTNASLEWAFDNVQIIWHNMKEQILSKMDFGASLTFQENRERFLSHIKENNGIVKKEVSNKFRKVHKKIRDQIIEDLIDTGEILKINGMYHFVNM